MENTRSCSCYTIVKTILRDTLLPLATGEGRSTKRFPICYTVNQGGWAKWRASCCQNGWTHSPLTLALSTPQSSLWCFAIPDLSERQKISHFWMSQVTIQASLFNKGRPRAQSELGLPLQWQQAHRQTWGHLVRLHLKSGWRRKSKIYFYLEPNIYNTAQLQYVCVKGNIDWRSLFTILPCVLEHGPEIIIFHMSQSVIGLNFSTYDWMLTESY